MADTVYSRIRTSRLYQQIVEQIEALILSGQLKPGDQLPSEREMAEQFSVSRTAVREAVKSLYEKGLVEIQTGRGTFITSDVDRTLRNTLGWVIRTGPGDRLADLTQVREILEPEIAAIAAVGATPDDILGMESPVATMDKALDDADKFIDADMEFHMALARATHNQLIPTLLDPIVGLLREQRLRIFWMSGGAERGQFHHKRILEAVRHKDPAAARSAMQAHLAQVRADSDVAQSAGSSLSGKLG
jgi:GntR family transcriptional repressor for pyruvate dehydrogenase complex